MTGPYTKAEVRRGELVAAARKVLVREGMAGATLRAVAAEAGVPLGTVHYIFPSKEKLLRAVLEDVVEEVSDAFRASVGSPTELEATMRETVLEVWSKFVEADPGQQVMQYELYLDVISTTWTEAAARAGVTLAIPADQLARLFLACADGLILQYLTLGDPVRARTDLETFVQQMVRFAAPGQHTTA